MIDNGWIYWVAAEMSSNFIDIVFGLFGVVSDDNATDFSVIVTS